MQKIIGLIIGILLILLNISCEKDDVCLQPGTPKIVHRFYDDATMQIKSVTDLTVIALPHQDTIFKNIQTDSLSLDLDVNKNFTDYILVSNGNQDTIHYTYRTQTVFISKSCGYKAIFEDLHADLIPDNNNWINSIEILSPSITIDTLAHVKIHF